MLLRSKSKVMRNPLKIQLFRERLSDERSVMPTGQDRKVVWEFIENFADQCRRNLSTKLYCAHD